MATDDEDLARQQYESSGRKKKKHKKDRDGLGKMMKNAESSWKRCQKQCINGSGNRNDALNNPIPCSYLLILSPRLQLFSTVFNGDSIFEMV